MPAFNPTAITLIRKQDPKGSVRAATTAALPANTRAGNVLTADANGALPAIDGVTLAINDPIERLLVKDEVAGANRGIYDVADLGSAGTKWVLTRSPNFDSDEKVTSGAAVFVSEGTANIGKEFTLLTFDPITINTTSLNFDQTGGTTPSAHAASHTDGTDDIQDATAAQKGVATAAQITKLDGIAAGAVTEGAAGDTHSVVLSGNPHSVTAAEAGAAPSSHVGAGGAAHANAVAAGAAGFMTGADKTKLNGIATGAEVNVAPGQLFRFEANQATYPGSVAAAGTTSRGERPYIAFDDTTDESVDFHGTMSHDYAGGPFSVDIHWLGEIATSGVGKWNAQFEAQAGQDADSDGFAAVQTATDTTNGTSGIETITTITFTQAQADAILAAGAFRLRLTRDTSVGSNMVDDAQVSHVLGRQ